MKDLPRPTLGALPIIYRDKFAWARIEMSNSEETPVITAVDDCPTQEEISTIQSRRTLRRISGRGYGPDHDIWDVLRRQVQHDGIFISNKGKLDVATRPKNPKRNQKLKGRAKFNAKTKEGKARAESKARIKEQDNMRSRAESQGTKSFTGHLLASSNSYRRLKLDCLGQCFDRELVHTKRNPNDSIWRHGDNLSGTPSSMPPSIE